MNGFRGETHRDRWTRQNTCKERLSAFGLGARPAQHLPAPRARLPRADNQARITSQTDVMFLNVLAGQHMFSVLSESSQGLGNLAGSIPHFSANKSAITTTTSAATATNATALFVIFTATAMSLLLVHGSFIYRDLSRCIKYWCQTRGGPGGIVYASTVLKAVSSKSVQASTFDASFANESFGISSRRGFTSINWTQSFDGLPL